MQWEKLEVALERVNNVGESCCCAGTDQSTGQRSRQLCSGGHNNKCYQFYRYNRAVLPGIHITLDFSIIQITDTPLHSNLNTQAVSK